MCTGAWLLAAAGLLDGRRATTHWAGLDQLAEVGVTPSKERVVIDGHHATAAGVSAGIDMALTLAGLIAGDDIAQEVQLIIEYALEPPHDAGSVDSAPAAVVESVRDGAVGLTSTQCPIGRTGETAARGEPRTSASANPCPSSGAVR